jgi:chemotaxis protein methyltransferase CheR
MTVSANNLAVPDLPVNGVAITDAEFVQLQRFIHEAAGISLSSSKKPMVAVRLERRLHALGFGSFVEYIRLLRSPDAADEVQTAIDLLTTNETYFFREPKHFSYLRQHLRSHLLRGQPFRAWSAASSSGEEAYSIAMLLADALPGQEWEVLGSDISQRVLDKARCGHYPLARIELLPKEYLGRFCLRGHGRREGTMLVERSLRERVRFEQINLKTSLPTIGPFDVIFLRNVLIYFDAATKDQVVKRVLGTLRPGGLFVISHCENIGGIDVDVDCVAPSIYRKKITHR